MDGAGALLPPGALKRRGFYQRPGGSAREIDEQITRMKQNNKPKQITRNTTPSPLTRRQREGDTESAAEDRVQEGRQKSQSIEAGRCLSGTVPHGM